jgi:ribonuclease PH
MRRVRIVRGYLPDPQGSALIRVGGTRVLCAATLEDRVPPWLRGQGRGWVTAEYGMLPRSSRERISRGLPGGRTHEIQRLIGRSLRSVTDLKALGERSIIVDCDVITADGGTRTAAITGGFVALYDLLAWMARNALLPKIPVSDFVAAVSVGIVEGDLLLDLDYEEDAKAQVDMNVVMTGAGRFVELQGTAEGRPFTREDMDRMARLAAKAIGRLVGRQKEALGIEKAGQTPLLPPKRDRS